MNGPGRYHDELQSALAECGATQGILIVLDGAQGPGFEVALRPKAMLEIPLILNMLAKEIAEDIEKLEDKLCENEQ